MKILITGDLFLEHPETMQIDDEVKQMFKDCDYRIVNLEGPIAWTKSSEEPRKSGPRLKQPKGVIRVLEELDADMLTLANNHLMDYGEDGYQQTCTFLKGRYVLAGCGTWEEAYRMKVIEADGLKVGVMNLCEMQFGMLSDRWTQGADAIGCAWVNHPSVDGLIAEYRRQVDKLLVIVHAGVEMVDVPLPEWRDRYRRLVDLGCDAVIAHHPHVVQGCEVYHGAPICYSLGNFCFVRDGSSDSERWTTGAVAVLDVSQEDVKVKLRGVRTRDRSHLTLLDENEWAAYHDDRSKMLDDAEYMNHVNEACLRLLDSYRGMFAMGGLFPADRHWPKHIGRIVLKRWDPVHALNNLQCESHRWCICRGVRVESSLRVQEFKTKNNNGNE